MALIGKERKIAATATGAKREMRQFDQRIK
jgi:hypothetical protein